MNRLVRLTRRLAARSPIIADPTGRREAAVALIWAPDPDALLLIRRAEHPPSLARVRIRHRQLPFARPDAHGGREDDASQQFAHHHGGVGS